MMSQQTQLSLQRADLGPDGGSSEPAEKSFRLRGGQVSRDCLATRVQQTAKKLGDLCAMMCSSEDKADLNFDLTETVTTQSNVRSPFLSSSLSAAQLFISGPQA